jgi:hypothetical protein
MKADGTAQMRIKIGVRESLGRESYPLYYAFAFSG